MRVVEWAMWAMPKALHQDLVHFRLIFKSRQGGSVESDMIRFQVSPTNLICTRFIECVM